MGIFDIYLPIAGIHFNVLILLAIGFAVGVLGGFFGVGGAWVSTARWATWTSSWA
jgi:hypothetical protein